MEEPSVSRAEEVFGKAPFIADLGIRLVEVSRGSVTAELEVTDRLRQQHGFAHAGVVSTLADHTAGAAASTMIAEGQSVLTGDYTIHLLRPASGDLLWCRGEVVKAGKRIIVVQSDVWSADQQCARYLGSMVVTGHTI